MANVIVASGRALRSNEVKNMDALDCTRSKCSHLEGKQVARRPVIDSSMATPEEPRY